jgi:hypothetical protein
MSMPVNINMLANIMKCFRRQFVANQFARSTCFIYCIALLQNNFIPVICARIDWMPPTRTVQLACIVTTGMYTLTAGILKQIIAFSIVTFQAGCAVAFHKVEN